MSVFKKAKRNGIKLKIGLGAVSGGGKTYGSLLLAKGLVGDLSKVALVDTENGSGNLYSDLGDYSIVDFAPPHHPQRYCKLIDLAVKEGFECLILDSISPEWDGEGGCLEIHGSMQGNSFSNWAKVTPMHKEFINKILHSPIHIIATSRRKQDYSMVVDGGKTKIEKVGLKEVQRDGTEYEYSINFSIDENNMALASKDRTGLFKDKIPFKISEETGKMIREWNNG